MRAQDRAFTAIFFASYRVPAAICTLLRACDIAVRSLVTGFWLGVLTPHWIECLDEWYYTRAFPQYLDSEYNRSGWFDWEKPLVTEYFKPLRSVLVAAGAGGGREMLALNRMGMKVVGYEYNPALVTLGNRLLKEEGWEPSLHSAPANALGVEPGEFDGIIMGWATYSLIPGRGARISLLREARMRCRKDGPLLISFFPRVGDRTFFRVSAAIANIFRMALRRPRVELGDTLAVSWAHRFTEEEVREELHQAGFQLLLFATEPYGHAVAMVEQS